MKYTEEQLTAARKYAAQASSRIGRHCLDTDYGFASHVTEKEKLTYKDNALRRAEMIERGELDHNLAVAQRMTLHLTGECQPIITR